MKVLKAFSISYEKYDTFEQGKKRKLFMKYKKIKDSVNEFLKYPETKAIAKESGKSAVKKIREELNGNETFYKVQLKHKNSKKEQEFYFNNRSEITRQLKEKCLEITRQVHDEREEKKVLKKKRKVYNNIPYYLIGNVHEKEGTFTLLKDSRKLLEFDTDKTPVTDNNSVGVEIEVHVKGTKNDVKMALLQYDKELASKITVKTDGSLRPNDGETGLELAILDTEYNIADTISKTIDALKDMSPRIDENCGLHVHLDMRNRVAETCFYNLVKAQNVLYKMQAPSRVENRYCQKVTETKIYKCISRGERYLGINPLSLSVHDTIEVRIHEGCFDKTQINNWIKLLVSIVSKETKLDKSYRAGNSLAGDIGLTSELTEYVENRIEEKAA